MAADQGPEVQGLGVGRRSGGQMLFVIMTKLGNLERIPKNMTSRAVLLLIFLDGKTTQLIQKQQGGTSCSSEFVLDYDVNLLSSR